MRLSTPPTAMPELDRYEVFRSRTGRIWLVFRGPTSREDMEAVLSLASMEMPIERARVVFDLRALVGHNPETRPLATDWLRREKHRLESVDVITGQTAAVIRMITSAVGLAVGIRIRIRDDAEGLD